MAQILGDPVLGTLSGRPGEFDLLSYIDDGDLMVRLGINAPSPVMGENNLKLIDGNTNEYISLQPRTPQQDLGSNVNQTCYYAIDTEEVSGFQGIAEVSDTNGCDNISHVIQLNEASHQTTGADCAAHMIINAPDNVSPFVMETNDNTPQVVLNALEPTVILAQESSNGFFIITGESYNTPVNLVETQSVIPVTASMSPDIPVAPIEEAVISNEQPNTPSPILSSGKNGQSRPMSSRRQRARKPKKYEITQELHDPMEEKKRLNAINAKKNRDRKKNKLKDLGQRVEEVTRERDQLRKEVEELKRREEQLRDALLSKNFIIPL